MKTCKKNLRLKLSFWISNLFSKHYFRANFRQGLVTGDKMVIYPIMKWCLEKIPELKKRAYLANYLVKINIPGEYMGDGQVIELYGQVTYFSYLINS